MNKLFNEEMIYKQPRNPTIDLSFADFFSWISITDKLVEPNEVF